MFWNEAAFKSVETLKATPRSRYVAGSARADRGRQATDAPERKPWPATQTWTNATRV
jgi:hypothetical protein